jgi:hypothetical protein
VRQIKRFTKETATTSPIQNEVKAKGNRTK